ncbi:MAG: 30S ribosomal protein S2, partial [Patescibacteria group bacterium]
KTIEEMAKAGVIYGHKRSKTHPQMKPYIAGQKNEFELIDPQATQDALAKAIEFLKEKVKIGGSVEKGLMLLVGTLPAAKTLIGDFAREFKFPYVTNRWLGGTLTNFKVINDRRVYYENLKNQKEKGLLSKYTKKEQLEFSREIDKLSQNFEGLHELTKIPDAIFVVDIKEHETAVREAKRTNVPIVAIVDTDDEVTQVEYPIFANDHARSSIEWVIEKIKAGVKQ